MFKQKFLLLLLILLSISITGCSKPISSSNDSATVNSVEISPSPFGVLGPLSVNFEIMKYFNFDEDAYFEWESSSLKNINVNFGRENNLLRWELHDESFDGNYVWSNSTKAFDSDLVLKRIYDYMGNDFNMILVISPDINGSVEYIGNDSEKEKKLQNFIEAAVERYNGDGINDYSSDIKVKYWQAYNEPFIKVGTMNNGAWIDEKKGSVESYARYVELLYQSIKKIDSNAKIVLGAEMSPVDEKGSISDEIKKVIELLKSKNAFDIVDVHYWGQAKDYKMLFLENMRNVLNDNGYSYVEIWACEFGTYVNDPTELNLPLQSETDQAVGTIKRIVYNLAHDIDKIFWTKLTDFDCYNGVSGGLFDNTGLVSDSANSGETEDLTTVKRLAYYSHQLFSKKFEDSNWDNIEIIQESNDIYIYQFTNKKDDKNTWVAWKDNGSECVSLNSIGITNAKMTESVPSYNTGKEIEDGGISFDNIFDISYSNENIDLGNVPIFIEKINIE